jgi:hypothetical protein
MPSTELLRVRSQRSKARGAGTPALLSIEQWEQTLADFNGLCAYCLTKPFEVMEHFMPVYVAGTTVNNCIPACNVCNIRKRNRIGDELIKIFGQDIIDRIGQYLASRSTEGEYHHSQDGSRKPTRKKDTGKVELIYVQQEQKEYSTLEEMEFYDIQDLFYCLSISMKELAEISGIQKVTLARIRDGKPTYNRTANKLLKVFSKIYERPFYLNRVTGINVAVSGKKKVKESQPKEAA